MITYSRDDQANYCNLRSQYLCAVAGTEPTQITSDTYEQIRSLLLLTLTEDRVIRARQEMSLLLFFANTIGYPEPTDA